MRSRTRSQIEFDIENQSKVCSACKKRKEFKDFETRSLSPDKKHSICRSCKSTASKMQMRTSIQIEEDLALQSKVCSTCKRRKSFEDFSLARQTKDKRTSKCKVCQSKRRVLYKGRQKPLARVSMMLFKYGINDKDLMDLMDKQRGCCSICGGSLVNPDSKQTFAVDHNHSTDVVRGLLCK